MNARSNYHDYTLFHSNREQFEIDNLTTKSQTESIKNVEMMSDSDEELTKVKLEKAVKEYKKNKCKHSETNYDAISKSNKINEKQSFFAKNFDDSGKHWTDLQELMNYFQAEKISQKKKPATKSYKNYEQQGAIPKSKPKNNSSEIIEPNASEMKSMKKLRQKKFEKKREIQFGGNESKNKSFSVGPKISEAGLSLYNFTVNPACDDVIVKIDEKICSTPFFYIVPNNPSPNFFFSPGSYYVIPKMPTYLHEKVIIFHPEKTSFSGYDKGGGLLKLEEKLSEAFTKCAGSSHESLGPGMNNLGKKVSRKEDSHLNIGPLDAKLSESFANLETSCVSKKTFEKVLLNPASFNTFNEVQKTKPKIKLTGRAEKTDFKIDEDDLTKNSSRIEMLSDSLLKEDEKNLGENNAKSNIEKGRERQIDQNLTVEFLDSDQSSGVRNVGYEYLLETEEGLELVSQRLLKRMVLALPDIPVEELEEKLFEFQEDENLIDSYIQETKQVMRIRQLVLDMQIIFPDADPNFLYQEIEKLKDDSDGGGDAINVLTEQLLESKAYPKISENNSNSESRSLWQKYIQNFNVKNFILKVSNPQDYAGPNGDQNEANMELILKFLMSRYLSESRIFLEESFKSNNNNLTKTCMALAHLETVRLSESTFQREAFTEAFLKEICYIDHKEEIDNYLEEIERKKNLEMEEARRINTFLSCPLCAEEELIAYDVIACPEGHVFCKECIKRYIFVKLGDGIYSFLCPLDKCDAFFSPENLEELLPESVLSTITKKQQAEEISNAKLDGLEFCPYCEFAYIPNPEDKIFKCQNPECLSEICRKCKEKSHIPFRCEEIERSIDLEARKKIEETMTEQLVRSCPTCFKKFVKIDGCNKMVCSCGTMMCYFCRAQIQGYTHFKDQSFLGTCPLYSDNEILHTRDVIEAGIQTRNYILQNNPDIHLVHDPTAN